MGIIQELPVSNGKAIADLVTLHSTAHCYEIKGSRDKLSRVLTQGEQYITSFTKVTLVTSSKQAHIAKKILPHYWGIIEVRETPTKLAFNYVQSAKEHSKQSKQQSLEMLWKNELLSIIETKNIALPRKHLNKAQLAELIAASLNKKELNNQICRILINRPQTSLRQKG